MPCTSWLHHVLLLPWDYPLFKLTLLPDNSVKLGLCLLIQNACSEVWTDHVWCRRGKELEGKKRKEPSWKDGSLKWFLVLTGARTGWAAIACGHALKQLPVTNIWKQALWIEFTAGGTVTDDSRVTNTSTSFRGQGPTLPRGHTKAAALLGAILHMTRTCTARPRTATCHVHHCAFGWESSTFHSKWRDCGHWSLCCDQVQSEQRLAVSDRACGFAVDTSRSNRHVIHLLECTLPRTPASAFSGGLFSKTCTIHWRLNSSGALVLTTSFWNESLCCWLELWKEVLLLQNKTQMAAEVGGVWAGVWRSMATETRE